MADCGSYNNVANDGFYAVNATYFVDANFGNDATGEYQTAPKPYRTLNYVANLATTGDVIFVQPGHYVATPINIENDVIWYFSAGAVIEASFLGIGSGTITGFGTFLGSSPVLSYTGPGNIMFRASNIFYDKINYAILLAGTGRVTVMVEKMEATNGFNIVGPGIDAEIILNTFDSLGTFINISSSAVGELSCNCHSVDTYIGINSLANDFIIAFDAQIVRCTSPYFITLTDTSVMPSSTLRLNVQVNWLESSGIVNASGIPSISNVLDQPKINLNIQTIQVLNATGTPLIVLDHVLCNLTYDTLAFEYLVPTPYIIDIQDGAVLHVDGSQTYTIGAISTGFINIASVSYSGVEMVLNRMFITGQIYQSTANATSTISVQNLTVIPVSTSVGIINNGQLILSVKNFVAIFPDGSTIIQNNADLFIEIENWDTSTNSSTFLESNARTQARVGRIVSSNDNNIYILTRGVATGLTIGSILLNGSNNLAISAQCATLVHIGQIIGTANSGNAGIIVENPGQLSGRIGRILMSDQSCIYFRSNFDSNMNFDTMSNGTNSYVINIEGTGEVTMSGNAIVAGDVKYPVLINTMGSRFNLSLLRMDILSCEAGIYVEADQSEININILHFHIHNYVGAAAIRLIRGHLVLSGTYVTTTSSNAPFISVTNDGRLDANLDFVESSNGIIVSDSSADLWYSAKKSVTLNNFDSATIISPGTGEKVTLGGFFTTPGDYNVNFLGGSLPSVVRILDTILISNTNSIISSGPTVNFICNGGIAKSPLNNAVELPLGTFLVNPGVQ